MATSRTRFGLSFNASEPAILSNIAAPVLHDYTTHRPSESFGSVIRPHIPQKPGPLLIGSSTTPGRTPPVVHFQPKIADSAIFLVQKGSLAPIEEDSDSSSSDSEEESPLSRKKFPPHDPITLPSPPAVPPIMAISCDSVRGVRPHGKSPFW